MASGSAPAAALTSPGLAGPSAPGGSSTGGDYSAAGGAPPQDDEKRRLFEKARAEAEAYQNAHRSYLAGQPPQQAEGSSHYQAPLQQQQTHQQPLQQQATQPLQ